MGGREKPAFTSCCGSTFLALPQATFPGLALANLSHLQMQPTPLSLLQTKSKALWYGGLKPEVNSKELPTNIPLLGKGLTDTCGVGDLQGAVPQLWLRSGAPRREARRKTKRVLFNCHVNKCLISSFARKCFPLPPHLISTRDGTALMAFLFHVGMTST